MAQNGMKLNRLELLLHANYVMQQKHTHGDAARAKRTVRKEGTNKGCMPSGHVPARDAPVTLGNRRYITISNKTCRLQQARVHVCGEHKR